MATYDVKRSIEGDIKSTLDDDGFIERTATDTYTILLDVGTDDDQVTVKANATDLPQEGFDSHPKDAFLRCVDVSVRKISVLLYEATVSYVSPKFQWDEDSEDTPVNELAAKIDFSSVTSQTQIDEDVDGNAMQMTSGEPFNVSKPISDLQVTIQKNFLTFNPTTFNDYINTVNADTFLGFAPGTARVVDIAASIAVRDSQPYWAVTVRIVFRRPYKTTESKAWYRRILNRGFYAYETAGDAKPRKIADVEGIGFGKPRNLAEDGTELAAGEDPYWLEFEIFETSSFNSMGLL